MIKYAVYNQNGEAIKETELSAKVFGISPNQALVHQALVSQMSNERPVLAHTKDRSEVRGGGKKPWKQKGTGRARAGSSRSPIWIGGGVTFGPTNSRNFSKGLNVKMKRQAMRVVLSDKATSNRLAILEALTVSEYKTKLFKQIIKALQGAAFAGSEGKVLVIDTAPAAEVKNSVRNLTDVKLITIDNINIVDILKYPHLVLTLDAVKTLEDRYAN